MTRKVTMFSGKFCGPCKIAKPFVEKFCSDNNIEFEYILVEECDDIKLNEYEIQAVPTMFLYNDDKELRLNGWTHQTPLAFHSHFDVDLV